MAVNVLTDCNGDVTKALAMIAGAGGALFFPTGVYNIDPVVLPHKTTLAGEGWGTILRLKAGASGPVISNQTGAHLIEIKNLQIDGNKASQTNPDAGGIYLDTSGTKPDSYTLHYLINNVLVRNCAGDGVKVYNGSSGQTRCENVEVLTVDGHGFVTSTDSFYSGCVAGGNGKAGFYMPVGNSSFSNCKAYTNGASDPATWGYGFYLYNRDYFPIVMSSCVAQANKQAGFKLRENYNSTLTACSAIQSGYGVTPLPADTAGFELDYAINNAIVASVGDNPNPNGTRYQNNALVYKGGGSSGNNIILTTYSGGPQGVLTLNGSAPYNTVVINGQVV